MRKNRLRIPSGFNLGRVSEGVWAQIVNADMGAGERFNIDTDGFIWHFIPYDLIDNIYEL